MRNLVSLGETNLTGVKHDKWRGNKEGITLLELLHMGMDVMQFFSC